METLISRIFEAAAKVSNEWSLTAFAMAALILIAYVLLRQTRALKGKERTLGVIIVMIALLASMPLIARAYLETHGLYRLRVTVEDDQGMPVNDAQVTCSIGGEAKKVEGGWEIDVPTGTKPNDGKLTIYAQLKNAFLSGKSDLVLTNDYNVATNIRLEHDRSAHIRGRVIDRNDNPIAGVQVSVVGYGSEATNTGTLGQFDLQAHAADGEQVEIAAFKKAIGSTSEWKQAGEHSVTIVLGR